MGLQTEMRLLAEAEAQENRIAGLERKLDEANLYIAKLTAELEAKKRELAEMHNGHGNPWYRPFYRTKEVEQFSGYETQGWTQSGGVIDNDVLGDDEPHEPSSR